MHFSFRKMAQEKHESFESNHRQGKKKTNTDPCFMKICEKNVCFIVWIIYIKEPQGHRTGVKFLMRNWSNRFLFLFDKPIHNCHPQQCKLQSLWTMTIPFGDAQNMSSFDLLPTSHQPHYAPTTFATWDARSPSLSLPRRVTTFLNCVRIQLHSRRSLHTSTPRPGYPSCARLFPWPHHDHSFSPGMRPAASPVWNCIYRSYTGPQVIDSLLLFSILDWGFYTNKCSQPNYKLFCSCLKPAQIVTLHSMK